MSSLANWSERKIEKKQAEETSQLLANRINTNILPDRIFPLSDPDNQKNRIWKSNSNMLPGHGDESPLVDLEDYRIEEVTTQQSLKELYLEDSQELSIYQRRSVSPTNSRMLFTIFLSDRFSIQYSSSNPFSSFYLPPSPANIVWELQNLSVSTPCHFFETVPRFKVDTSAITDMTPVSVYGTMVQKGKRWVLKDVRINGVPSRNLLYLGNKGVVSKEFRNYKQNGPILFEGCAHFFSLPITLDNTVEEARVCMDAIGEDAQIISIMSKSLRTIIFEAFCDIDNQLFYSEKGNVEEGYSLEIKKCPLLKRILFQPFACVRVKELKIESMEIVIVAN